MGLKGAVVVRPENVTGPVMYHAEGPVWSGSWGGLRWVDMFAGDLVTLRDTGVERLHVGTLAAFHRPRLGGGYVVATDRGLEVSDTADGQSMPFAPALRLPRGRRFNDGACSPAGTLYAGSMSEDGSPGGGQLLRVEASGRADVVLDGVGISNGLAFSPDGLLAYYVDTSTGRVDLFDNEEDRLVRRRPFVAVDPDDGAPDGLTVDSEGGVWVALWGGSCVRGYDPQGRLQQVVTLPARQVSACTFGGTDLSTLYVTTSRENLPEGEDPQAGSVFAATPGVRGAAPLPFWG
jgi:sugar lactone lactonase YvrE